MTRAAVLLTGAIAIALVARAASIYRGTDPLAFALVLLIGFGLILGLAELLVRAGQSERLGREIAALPAEATIEIVDATSPSLRGLLRARLVGVNGTTTTAPFTPYLLGLLVMIGMLGTFLGLFETLRGAREALTSSGDVDSLRAGLAAPMVGLSRAFGCSAGVSASAMLGLGAVFVRRAEAATVSALARYVAGPLARLTTAGRQLVALEALALQGQALPEAAAALRDTAARLEKLEAHLLDGQTRSSAEAAAAIKAVAAEVRGDLAAGIERAAKSTAAVVEPLLTSAVDRAGTTAGEALSSFTGRIEGRLTEEAELRREREKAHLAAMEATIEEQATAQLDALQSRTATQAATLHAQMAAQLEALQSRTATHAGAIETQLAEQIEALEERTVALADTLQTQAKAQLDAVEARTVTLADTLQTQAKAQLDAVEARTAALADTLQTQAKAQLDAVEARTVTLADTLQAQSVAQLHALQTRTTELTTTIEARMAAQIDALQERTDAQTTALRAQIEALTGDARAQMAAQIAALQSRTAAHASAMEAQMKARSGTSTRFHARAPSPSPGAQPGARSGTSRTCASRDCAEVRGFPVFDVILLGLGPDGHLMSVFPGSEAFDRSDWALAIPAPTHVEPHVERVTLNPAVLGVVRNLLMVTSGAGKAGIVGRIFRDERDVRTLPGQLARRSGATWILDEAAAADVPEIAVRG